MWIPGFGRYVAKPGNRVGDDAPDFTLPDQDGKQVRLKDQLGDLPVVLVFYPRASSPICTVQMCSLRNGWDALQAKAKVFGVSYDAPDALKRFKEQDRLPFALLSDPDKKVAKAYGVAGTFAAARVSFVISPDGKIKAVITDIKADNHNSQLLAAV
ncbi:MAG: peroxiredoxin [Planctomycetes bacterium]|nr:peroxiredoxin [Planctomycetota bacterium]MCW8136726.1 peroxiredoxin [Planctomycetota bacterium]